MKGVNPADAYRTLKTLTDVWDAAAERMLTTVTKRLARGITEPGWAERKSGEVLLVRAELQGIVRQHLSNGLEERATDALAEAYEMGAKVAERLDETAIETNVGRVVRLATLFTRKLRGTFVPVLRAHEDVYQRAVGDSELLMATGTIVRREAVAQAVSHLVESGEDAFRAGDGKRWHLDSYVRMAGRTMSAQAIVEGQLDGMIARGRDLVLISDSPRECTLCEPWEGKLLSITGASVGQEFDGHDVVSTVSLARAAGLWHPNCTHRPDPFTPGLTLVPEPTANPEGYAAAQKLRRLEREVRQLKRALAAVQQLGDTHAARRLREKIRAKHAQIAAHAEATGQLRRRERERPVGTDPGPSVRASSTPPPVEPEPPAVPNVPPAPRKPDPAELSWLSDEELDLWLTRATEGEDFDFLDAIVGELDRREATASQDSQTSDEADDERWVQLEQLVGQGWSEEQAVAEVFGKSVEQQRRDRAIAAMRDQGYRGNGFDELARQAYRDEVYRWYLAAEEATRGHLLTPSAQAAGVDPHALFTGPAARARKHASDELKAWWDEHGRVTFEQFVADILGDTTGSLRARFRTGGEGWLQ